MKLLVGQDIGSYSFNPATRQVTISGIPDAISLEQLLIITNVTSNVIIYNFADPALGVSAIAGDAVGNDIYTLDYDTTGMASTDRLQIYIDMYYPQPVAIDPAVGAVIDGIGVDGVVRPVRVGSDGGLQPTDAPNVLFATIAGNAVIDFFNINTTGYQSLCFQISGTWATAGTLNFYFSNDRANWIAASGYSSQMGYMNGAITYGASTGMWLIPCIGKYFKISKSGAGTGTINASLALRQQPAGVIATTALPSNLTQIAANPFAAAGAPWTNQLLPMGGIDGAGKLRMPLTEVDGALRSSLFGTLMGQRVAALTDNQGQLRVRQSEADGVNDSILELLANILAATRETNFWLRSLPQYINASQNITDEELILMFRDDPSYKV